jgi:hypothetical protein
MAFILTKTEKWGLNHLISPVYVENTLRDFVFRGVRKIEKSDYYLRHVCLLSVRTQKHGSHWTDCHEI